MTTYSSARLRLNKTGVDSLAPPKAGVLVARDDLIPGFHVKVSAATGRKTYYVRTKGNDIKIGRHEEITAESARTLAKHILGKVAAGMDPRPTRRNRKKEAELAARQSITFGEVCELYHTEYKKRDVGPSAFEKMNRWVNSYLKPKLGGIAARDLDAAHIRAFHNDFRHVPTDANNMLVLISSICNFAEPQYREPNTNPCWRLVNGKKEWVSQFYPEHKRKRCLSSEELERLADAIIAFETSGRITPAEADFFRVKMLTGCRTTELYRLQWTAVHINDDGSGYFDLPEHKTKKKTGEHRYVPLSNLAAALINRQPRLSNYVFYNPPGANPLRGPKRRSGPIAYSRIDYIWSGRYTRKGRRYKEPSPWQVLTRGSEGAAIKDGIRYYAGIPDAVPHDFRRTAATIAGGKAGLNAHTICKMYGWKRLQQADTYVRPPMDPVIAGANAIAAGLLPGLKGLDLASLGHVPPGATLDRVTATLELLRTLTGAERAALSLALGEDIPTNGVPSNDDDQDETGIAS